MTTVFQNSGWGRPSCRILATMHFQCNRFALNRNPNVFTKVGEDHSNSKEMSTIFKIQDDDGFFYRHRCALNQSSNIPTKFIYCWSNSKEMATVFRNSSRHIEFLQICISDVIDMFHVEDPMFPLILVIIVKKWQQFFGIQDGGGRHLELCLIRYFDVTVVF